MQSCSSERSRMGEPKRYFINNLPDEGVSIDVALQKQRTEELVQTVVTNFKQQLQNADGGLYVGLGGVSYMFFHLSKLAAFQSQSQQYLKSAEKFLKIPLQVARQSSPSSVHVTDRTGFLTGNVGVYAVAAVIYKKRGMDKEAAEYVSLVVEAGNLLKPLNWFRNGGDELFVGRAGYLCAILWLRRELGAEILPESDVDQMLNTMVESGKHFALAVRSPFPLMYHYYSTQYLGAAHGMAGILFVMLCFPKWLERNAEAKRLVQTSVDCYLQLQTPNGNFPCAMDEVDNVRPAEEELVHWCHGAPGAVYLMAKAYLVFKDEKYLTSALKCGEITWQKGLLRKGAGICHGVAGSGYVFLLLHQLTQDPRQLHRASHFMNFIYTSEFSRARKPDCPFSLYEGLAGTACFAGDLTEPARAHFPFFGIG